MHEIAAARKAAATVGATEVAVAGRKRGRHAMGSTAANEGEKAMEGASLAAADGCCAGAGCAHSGASPGPVAASTEEAVAEAAFASAQPGVRPTRLSKEEDDAERAAYRRVNELLLGTFTSTEPAFLAARLAKARTVFSNMSTLFKLEPNARTYVLMLKTALNAGDVEYARSLVHSMFASGVASPATLYQFLQPAFLAQLRDAGVISAADASITHPPGSQASCYLAAAAEAAKGNQYGSKHGAVLVKDGRVLALGHNHRYATRGNPHVRVMHAEVHALIQLPTEQHARGTECYIVELDAEGIGYEEAIPCPMCQTALCQLGVAKAHYSSHSGIITVPVSYRPHLHCETYTMALAREYPKGTHKPDTPVPEYLQAQSADATGTGASVDAATTATEIAAAPVNVAAERVATATTVASASAALADAVAAALPQEAQLA
ncbi:hypothetical protein EON66_07960 [archaeon]|nr:MAG: hypothetical protein EON66_07960 [archaeon]